MVEGLPRQAEPWWGEGEGGGGVGEGGGIAGVQGTAWSGSDAKYGTVLPASALHYLFTCR